MQLKQQSDMAAIFIHLLEVYLIAVGPSRKLCWI